MRSIGLSRTISRGSLAILLLTAVLLQIVPSTAYADAVVYPNNNFMRRHLDDCKPHNRSYYANGSKGYTAFRREPGSFFTVGVKPNGEVVFISYTYEYHGSLWGIAYMQYGDDDGAWLKMDELVEVYDSDAFVADHHDEVHPYTGDSQSLAMEPVLVSYTWPGSGELCQTNPRVDDDNWSVAYAYTDSQGREWLAWEFLYGRQQACWVCADEPANRAIEAFNPAPAIDFYPSVKPNIIAANLGVVAVCGVAVAALGLVSFMLIRRFSKPARRADHS